MIGPAIPALRAGVCALLPLLVLPAPAAAQRDEFFDALFPFYRAVAGVYGDEGPLLTAHLETLASTLARWDAALGATERQLRERLRNADAPTALEVHTVLAAAYAERNRFEDALREIDEDIRIDPARPAFHRLKALLLLAMHRPEEAADAFRDAWLLDPADPRHAYRLVVHPSARTTAAELERATATLARLERDLVRGERGPVEAPFLVLNSLSDDVGGVMAFAPAAYAPALALLLDGRFEEGIAALRMAVASDPLVVDPASRLETMARGIAEMRHGTVPAAIEHLEAAVAQAPDSSEAHRVLATAYGTSGDVTRSVHHLREAVRLTPLDERSWIALAGTLDTTGHLNEAIDALRTAIGHLPESGALQWVLSVLSVDRGSRGGDLQIIALADRLVMLAGRADLYGRVAGIARGHLHYDRAVDLLEQRVALMPNDAIAHKDLGVAYLEQGLERAAHAELVIALMLDPDDPGTLTSLGRVHLLADAYTTAVDALERAVDLAPHSRQAFQALGDALVRAGRITEGHARLQEAEVLQARAVENERRERRTSVLIGEAELLMLDHQYDRAVDVWLAAMELDDTSPAMHLRLAEALAGADRLEEAVGYLERAIALNAGPEAHRRLAALHATLGRHEESARARQTYMERRLQPMRAGSN